MRQKGQNQIGSSLFSVELRKVMLPFIVLSYNDLKELSKAITRVNKLLKKYEDQNLELDLFSNDCKSSFWGDGLAQLANEQKLAGMKPMILKELMLSDDFLEFKKGLKAYLESASYLFRDPEQPEFIFSDSQILPPGVSKFELWVPKLLSLESWGRLYSLWIGNSICLRYCF